MQSMMIFFLPPCYKGIIVFSYKMHQQSVLKYPEYDFNIKTHNLS